MYDNNGVINQTSVLAKNAVDGNDDTYWCSGESDNQWLTVDLGRNYDIGRVVIDWNSDAGKMYDIQVSADGNNWTTVYRQLKGYGYEVADIPMFATARYVRMNGYTRVESGSGFSIKEFEVYEYKTGDARPTYDIPNFPESYVAAKLRCNVDYTDRMAFAKKQWLNICNAGKFSSDRTIADYAENIWDIQPVKVD